MAAMMLIFVVCALITQATVKANYCRYYKVCYRTVYTSCGFLWLSRCSRTTSDYCDYQECCGGWTGSGCSFPICSQTCKNGGTCDSPNTCRCTSSYTGNQCDTPVCNPTCTNGGSCVSPNTCSCTTSYTGIQCETPVCSPACQNGGTCVSPNLCACTPLYTGIQCETPVCDPACQNGGSCISPNTCRCTDLYTGAQCELPVCILACQNGGSCVSPNTCRCSPLYTGTNCEQPICSPACNNGGSCVSPNTCRCNPLYTGLYCETLVTTTSTTTPKPFSTGINDCNFDTGTLCGWNQVENDNFDWMILSGPTLGPGPKMDHTMESADGRYLYIDSASHGPGEFAYLASSVLPAEQTTCFEFWSFMYGIRNDDIGSLYVYIQDDKYRNMTEIFKKSGNHGNKWIRDSVTIQAKDVPRSYRLVLKAEVGPSRREDISIDDLSTTEGTCEEKHYQPFFG